MPVGLLPLPLAAAAVPITLVDVSSTTYASRTNTTVSAPAGIAADDIIIAQVLTGVSSEAPDPTPPSGFQQVGSTTDGVQGGFNVEMRIYWKRASSEPSSYTFTHAAASSQASIVALRGVDWSAGPFDVAATTSSGTGGDPAPIMPSLIG